MTDDGQTTPSVLIRAAATAGDDLAVVDGNGDGNGGGNVRLTYRELLARTRVAARAFVAFGVEPGDRVAIWAPNTWHWVVAAFATHFAGAILVPINTRYTAAEASDILHRTDARLLVVPQSFLGVDRSEVLDAMDLSGAMNLPGMAVLTFSMNDDDAPAPGHSRASTLYWEQIGSAAARTPESCIDARIAALTPESVSDILFTSGTTGRSKGATSAHRQSLAVAGAWAECTGLRSDDRYLVVNPFFHSFGFKAGILAAVGVGAAIHPMAVYDPEATMRSVDRESITVLPGAPTIFSTLLDHPSRHRFDLTSLRLAVTGAAVVPVSLIERMRNELTIETILTAYGLTEAVVATMCRPGDDAHTVASTSGRAAAGFELRIAASGEIQLRGPNVMLGYLDDPEATAAAVDEDGWLSTGDVGRLDERGYLTVTDRLKDMYISGGFNVYPAEVEQALLAVADIADAAVVGAPDGRLGEVGVAFVVPNRGVVLDVDDLRARCRERIAGFKVPTRIEVRDALPRNAGGKVLKRVLREEIR